MKSLILISSLFVTAACSVEVKEPKKDIGTSTATSTETSTSTKTSSSKDNLSPTRGICSFDADPNKGCLKATIASTRLAIGDFFYEIGPKELTQSFTSDIQSIAGLEPGQYLVAARTINQKNFFEQFTVGTEGSHTTYQAFHTGLGNLSVNKMFAGYYQVFISKDFDFLVYSKTKEHVGFRCVYIYTSIPVNIEMGIETALPEAIASFELKVYNQSCTGNGKLKTKTNTSSTVSNQNETEESTGTNTNTSL